MSRRPLGAAIPPAERPAALEAKIRAIRDATDRLEEAWIVFQEAPSRRRAERAYIAMFEAFADLLVTTRSPIRARETVARRQTPAERER